MLTIGIPQLYCGASGQKGAYNRQEVGLARAFAALGCRAVAIYPDTALTAPKAEDLEPMVRVLYLPARALGVHAFYKSWQPLLDERIDAVHVMGDNSLGVPGLYHFCRRHGIYFYSQLGALKSARWNARTAAVRYSAKLIIRGAVLCAICLLCVMISIPMPRFSASVKTEVQICACVTASMTWPAWEKSSRSGPEPIPITSAIAPAKAAHCRPSGALSARPSLAGASRSAPSW